MTTKLQGTIEQIRTVIAAIGPATARQIETHPDVVAACRSSKAKARRLIERLNAQGHIYSTGDAQQPKYWVEEEAPSEVKNWDFDESHNKPLPRIKTMSKTGSPSPLFTTVQLAKEFGVTRIYLLKALLSDADAPKKVKVHVLSLRNNNYYSGKEIRAWWADRKNNRITDAS